MPLTYPRAHKLSVGYDTKEDRLFLIFHLQNGDYRKALLSRRLLDALLVRMSEELASSHPMVGHTAQRDEMLQMEHLASVSVQTAEPEQPVQSGHQQGQIPSQAQQPQETQQLPSRYSGSFLITDAHVEVQQGVLVVGWSGEWLNDQKTASEPIAALGLARSEAHRVLRLLRDKAEVAGWNMAMPAQWLQPLEYGKALGAQ